MNVNFTGKYVINTSKTKVNDIVHSLNSNNVEYDKDFCPNENKARFVTGDDYYMYQAMCSALGVDKSERVLKQMTSDVPAINL